MPGMKVWVIALTFLAGGIVGYTVHEFYNTPPIDTIVLNGSDYSISIPTDSSEFIVLLPTGLVDSVAPNQTYTINNSGQAGGNMLHIRAANGITIRRAGAIEDEVIISQSESAKFQYIIAGGSSHWEHLP